MLNSLARDPAPTPLTADTIVIGAGLAGLFLATRLVALGQRVLVLESGPKISVDAPHPLNQVETTAEDYKGARHGRFRRLGGTSAFWGGALLPYLPDDLGPHPGGWHDGWHLPEAALDGVLAQAEAAFGVTHDAYEPDETWLTGFLTRRPKWPAFRNRNTAHLFAKPIGSLDRLSVWTDATVTEICLRGGRVTGAVAQSEGGHRLQAHAETVVIACGAIETTRQLLLLDRQAGGLFPPDGPLGRGFHDHLSAPIADLIVKDRRAITRLFGFRFVPGGLRNTRFELAPSTRAEAGLSAAFLHIAFTRPEASGFEALRRILQALQRRALPTAHDLWGLVRDAPWFLRALWWRAVEKRVYPPTGAGFELHLVTEQCPAPEQRIDLSETEIDTFGLPRARIHWRVRQADLEQFDRIAALTESHWRESTISRFADLRLRAKSETHPSVRDGGGIYHPAGTTCIGSSPESGVVDNALCVYGVSGLRALATSVFPSVGGTSPSLALVQLALRMAQDIATGSRGDSTR